MDRSIINSGISRRFVRIPPDFKDKPLIVEGDFEEISEHRRPPRKGEHVSILDAALVESGLALHFLRDLIPGQEITWSIIDGRRPQIHHSEPINFENKQERMLVQATGRIKKLVHSELSLDTISHLVDASREYGFGKLTLRVALEPQLYNRRFREVLTGNFLPREGRMLDLLRNNPTIRCYFCALKHNRLLAPRTEAPEIANLWRSLANDESRS